MPEEEAPPCDNLYVQNLPADITEDRLKSVFGGGVVKQCKVLPSKNPGQSTCVALVRFESVEAAQFVRETMDGQVLPGLDMPVTLRYNAGKSKAQGKGDSWGWGDSWGKGGGYGKAACGKGGAEQFSPYGGAGDSGGKGGKGEAPPGDNLYITGLPNGVDEEFMKALLGEFGTIVQCKVMPSKDGVQTHSMVRFQSVEEATYVKENCSGQMIEGTTTPIKIDFAYKKDTTASWNGGGKGWGGSGGGVQGGGGGGGKGKGAPKGGEWWPAAKGGGWGMDSWGGDDWWGGGGFDGWKGYGGKDGKGGKGGKGKGRSGERGPPPTPTGRVLVGTIKSFSEKTGYGFISCDETQAEFGGDVFVSGKEINGATVGSMVTFNLVVSSKGQPQAQGVQTEGDAAAEPAAKKPRLEGAEHAFGGEEQAFGGEEQAFGGEEQAFGGEEQAFGGEEQAW
mmetsp:Transcript_8035/g.19953  ORF Transcript_8035/g.19953 Transcript_8035/m.19953 type:complete len:449 (+) Transcript_8035:65-1411(+)